MPSPQRLNNNNAPAVLLPKPPVMADIAKAVPKATPSVPAAVPARAVVTAPVAVVPTIANAAVDQKAGTLAQRIFAQVSPYFTKQNAAIAAAVIVVSYALYKGYQYITALNLAKKEDAIAADFKKAAAEYKLPENVFEGATTAQDKYQRVETAYRSVYVLFQSSMLALTGAKTLTERQAGLLEAVLKELETKLFDSLKVGVKEISSKDDQVAMTINSYRNSLNVRLLNDRDILTAHVNHPRAGHFAAVKDYANATDFWTACKAISDRHMAIYNAMVTACTEIRYGAQLSDIESANIQKGQLSKALTADDQKLIAAAMKDIQDLNEQLRLRIVAHGRNKEVVEGMGSNITFTQAPNAEELSKAVKGEGSIFQAFNSARMLGAQRTDSKTGFNDGFGVFGGLTEQIPAVLKTLKLFTSEKFNAKDTHLLAALKAEFAKDEKEVNTRDKGIISLLIQIMEQTDKASDPAKALHKDLRKACDFLKFDDKGDLAILDNKLLKNLNAKQREDNRIAVALNGAYREVREEGKDVDAAKPLLTMRTSGSPATVALGHHIEDPAFLLRKAYITDPDRPGEYVLPAMFTINCDQTLFETQANLINKAGRKSVAPNSGREIKEIASLNWNEAAQRVGVIVTEGKEEQLISNMIESDRTRMGTYAYRYTHEGMVMWKLSLDAIFGVADATDEQKKKAAIELVQARQAAIFTNDFSEHKLSFLAAASQFFTLERVKLLDKCMAEGKKDEEVRSAFETKMYDLLAKEFGGSVTAQLLKDMDTAAAVVWAEKSAATSTSSTSSGSQPVASSKVSYFNPFSSKWFIYPWNWF